MGRSGEKVYLSDEGWLEDITCEQVDDKRHEKRSNGEAAGELLIECDEGHGQAHGNDTADCGDEIEEEGDHAERQPQVKAD